MTRSKGKASPDLLPTARELRWFAQIDRHGPQSSDLLYRGTQSTHSCKDTALRRLQALREANYLRQPVQQEQITRANFNPKVYDLTAKGFEYLSYHKTLERHARPTGHWWHGLWVSCVSSLFDIHARRQDLEYVPAARIVGLRNVPMGIPLHRGTLVPDQIFAIRYRDGFRMFALEVDRGTEPVKSPAARKSLRRSVMGYQEILACQLHQKHYSVKSNLIVLYVFMSQAREAQFLELIGASKTAFRTAHCRPGFPRREVIHPLTTLLRF